MKPNKIASTMFMMMAFFLLIQMPVTSSADDKTLNIYSYRQEFLLRALLDEFEAATGIKTNVLYAKKGLLQRLKSEGANSPADLVFGVDILTLQSFANDDLFQPISSAILAEKIPANLKSENNLWFGLSKRARILVASNDRVAVNDITAIEELADSKWKGRICTRAGSHVYNRALMASLIVALGEDAAQAWVNALVGNLARKPQGNDRAQIRAVAAGVCDLAIVNNYYYSIMKNNGSGEDLEAVSKTHMVFLNQEDRGNHINITGAGVTKHAPNPALAVSLLEYLATDGQSLLVMINHEFPVLGNPTIGNSATPLVTDEASIDAIGHMSSKAQMMIDQAGW